MSELDELRQKKLRELQMAQQQRGQQQAENQLREEEIERQISIIMRQIMSSEARERLSNIKLARPDFARQVEILLIQLYQSGRLRSLNDEQLKALLTKLSSTKRKTNITFK
ncbi:MAG: DNA-binding protein [Candidatus Altiarchaeales archaeon]|nr:DNA-binding protein [Candidatus Altiarchaeales archaeon]MBD3415724.1 DNA-binding protein [Candidatus Altiarchaeales archaeon]